MKDIEYICEFACHLGMGILSNGGTLERANDKMTLICQSYGLKDISIFSLSSILILSAKDEDGFTCSRQIKVKSNGIHVEKLNRYNALAFQVCTQRPKPETLMPNFEKMGIVLFDYAPWMTLFGFCLALSCLCRMFGGNIQDILCVNISTIIMYGISSILNSPGMNSIIKNFISMFVAASLAIFYMHFKIGKNIEVILITNAFMIIPGIPMVNAIRNILQGNEMNGIIELLKVVLETFAILVGIVLSFKMLGGLL